MKKKKAKALKTMKAVRTLVHAKKKGFYNDLGKIRDAVTDTAITMSNKAADVISHSVDNVLETSSTIQDNMATYVSDKPFRSVGAAILSGMLMGYMMHKNTRYRR